MNDLLKITDDQEQFIQKMLDETKKDFDLPDYSVEDGETIKISYVSR